MSPPLTLIPFLSCTLLTGLATQQPMEEGADKMGQCGRTDGSRLLALKKQHPLLTTQGGVALH